MGLFSKVRHALFGYDAEEQAQFLRLHIYRVTRWIEQLPADEAVLIRELHGFLADLDRAEERVSRGKAMPRAAFALLVEDRDRLHRAVERVR